jgi:hypothetical protein
MLFSYPVLCKCYKAEIRERDLTMRTARQSGWSLIMASDAFIALYNDNGDYLEMSVLPPGIALLNPFDSGIGIFDLPQSVLDLCVLWLCISIPFEGI